VLLAPGQAPVDHVAPSRPCLGVCMDAQHQDSERVRSAAFSYYELGNNVRLAPWRWQAGTRTTFNRARDNPSERNEELGAARHTELRKGSAIG